MDRISIHLKTSKPIFHFPQTPKPKVKLYFRYHQGASQQPELGEEGDVAELQMREPLCPKKNTRVNH